ncbi:MAG: type III-B CRISPR module RAMP protein Cmr4 [Anaerolineae bacterium]|nr:type III-B CRISPR module RAMP protein Cmr4 [Anaerolineae bacterium]
MDAKTYILYVYTETPLHAGTGTGLGAVDLPIQREKHTAYPIIQASGMKGALRDTAELSLRGSAEGQSLIKSIFGSDSDNREIVHASAISPSDARILLFPVRALNGVFVWVTSPTVLERFKQESGFPGQLPEVPSVEQNSPALVSSKNLLIQGQVMLEEFTYPAQENGLAQAWAEYLAVHALHREGNRFWQDRLYTHFVILPDNEFRDFVRYSTDIVTRIHIDDVKKTVKDGQLFTQELLPADSLMYSIVHVTDTRDEDRRQAIPAEQVVVQLQQTIGNRLQIGADETVGRGRVRLAWQGVK